MCIGENTPKKNNQYSEHEGASYMNLYISTINVRQELMVILCPTNNIFIMNC